MSDNKSTLKRNPLMQTKCWVRERHKANKKIIELLQQVINESEHSGLRFHQILYMLEVTKSGIDQFYEESEFTLARMLKSNYFED